MTNQLVIAAACLASLMPHIWNVELPAWAPGCGFQRVSGTKFVVGVGRNGELYGTPDVLGQAALFISGDEGRTWKYWARLPHMNAQDHIERITSFCCGAMEILFVSMNQGGLYVSSDGFGTCSPNLIPGWYRCVAPRTAFNGNLLVEQVDGRAARDCRVLACLYGQRLEGAQKHGSLCVFRTDATLGQMAAGAAPRLQLAWRQDAFDFYARHVASALSSGSGMHLHCAAWDARSRNGESNVLFVSFGDKDSGHVCRIAGFDRLPPCGDECDGAGSGWNYSDRQVFAVHHQPTGMWAEGGKLYFLARDYDGTTLVTPDDVFDPQVVFCDSFAPCNSSYSGVHYDAWVRNGVAIVANVIEREAGQYGVYVGDPTGSQQMFRYVRGRRAAAASDYAGFSAVFGNAQNDAVVVTADSFGSGALANTWLTHGPVLRNVQTVLVANACSNLIPNAGWYAAAGSPACFSVLHNGDDFWRITLTNAAQLVQYNQRAVLSGFAAGTPLCASIAYRFPAAYHSAKSDAVSFQVEWRDAEKIIRMDSIGGLQSVTTHQWRTASMRVVPPANAIEGRWSILCHNYTGAVDIAIPSANWNRFAVPANGRRAADELEYDSNALKARTEFLVLPLWPTDIDPGEAQTLCSMESSDGARCRLTWDYTLGFQAVLENNLGELSLTLNLGQLHTLTRFDPCRFSLDFQCCALTARLDAGADVLEATGATTAIHSFKPVKIRLGSDMFSKEHPGWEGYYALLNCH